MPTHAERAEPVIADKQAQLVEHKAAIVRLNAEIAELRAPSLCQGDQVLIDAGHSDIEGVFSDEDMSVVWTVDYINLDDPLKVALHADKGRASGSDRDRSATNVPISALTLYATAY